MRSNAEKLKALGAYKERTGETSGKWDEKLDDWRPLEEFDRIHDPDYEYMTLEVPL